MLRPTLTLVHPTRGDVDALLDAIRQLERDREMEPVLAEREDRASMRRFATEPEPITGFGALLP